MKARFLITLFLLAIGCQSSQAEVKVDGTTTFVFATVEQAGEILTKRDDFVAHMSPFDRAARMKTKSNVSEEDYLKFVGKNLLEWNDAEKQTIIRAFQGIQSELEGLALPFPREVLLVKTTGNEEGGAEYTRSNAVVFPIAHLARPIAAIQKTIAHELFHILSRENADLREALYAAIGFVKCDDVAFPAELRTRKITNPDAPRNDHCLRIHINGNEQWAVPILFARSEKYDEARGGEFFNYLQFQLLLVERDDSSSGIKPMYSLEKPMLADVQQVSGYFEQVGRNTGYIIHPEEILADNFSLLVLRERSLSSPLIIKKLEAILKKQMAGVASFGFAANK